MRSSGAAAVTAAGAVLLVGVVFADRIFSDRGLFDEWPPDGSWPYWLRAGGLAVGSFLALAGARVLAVSKLQPAGLPAFSHARAVLLATAVSVVIAVGSALLVVLSPDLLTDLVQEDGPVEWASAVLSFGAGGLVLAAAARHWHHRSGGDRRELSALALVGLAGVFVLLGLEEASWFQRVLEVDTPGPLVDRNIQGEMNLHNIATDETENAYYFGAFGFAVVAPLLFADRRLPDRIGWLQPLIPSLAVLYSAVVASAVVYMMWNVAFIQIAFWMSLTAMMLATPPGVGSGLGRFLMAAMVIVAGLYLTGGDAMVRDWDDTEIREVIIPFSFVVYGLGALAMAPTTTAPVGEPEPVAGAPGRGSP